jgi:hypothetical protein
MGIQKSYPAPGRDLVQHAVIKHWGLSGNASAHSLARFVAGDRFAAPKTPTFHTATVGGNFNKTKTALWNLILHT